MLRKSSLIVAAFITFAAFTPGLAASMGGHPACNPETVLENDDVRVAFKGHKGMVQVFRKNTTDGGIDGMYQYKTAAVREIGADNATLASMDLGRAYPQESNCSITETDEFLDISFTVPGTVRGANGGGDVGEATVTFAYHFNKSSNGAKFDLFVADWPWQGDSELAFDFSVQSGAWNVEAAENGIGFRSDEGEPKAFLSWAPNATATYEDGHNETAIVDATVDAGGHEANVSLRFTTASSGYVDLAYDPWVGVGAYVIIAGFLVGDRDVVAVFDTLRGVIGARLP